MLWPVYQSCPSGQVSAAHRCAVLMQSCEPMQVHKLRSCISKRFQEGLLAWAESHPSQLLRWSCAPAEQSLPASACTTCGTHVSFKTPCPCVSFSSAFNNKGVPFTTITSQLHIYTVSVIPGEKSFVLPPDEGILLRRVAEHALGCCTLLCALLGSEEGRERNAPQTLSIQKFTGVILKKCLLCSVKGMNNWEMNSPEVLVKWEGN